MILDALFSFTSTSGDSITSSSGTITSGNIIDLGGPALPASQSSPYAYPFRDVGIGDDPALKLLVVCVTTFAGGTSLAISLQGAPDNGSGSPGTFVTWYTTPAVVLASLVQGARLMDMDMPRPPQGVVEPRFLQLAYTVSGTFTGSTLRGYIVLDRHDQIYSSTNNSILSGYAPGIVIQN